MRSVRHIILRVARVRRDSLVLQSRLRSRNENICAHTKRFDAVRVHMKGSE